MEKINIADKSVIQNLGFCSHGMTSNVSRVDTKDGKIVRVRPLHYDESYTKDELNYYQIKKGEHVWEPKFKSLLPPISLAYKKRAYSPARVPYPLKRVDFDPNGERNIKNRGKSKYVRISWDEALEIVAAEIKRIHDEYGPHAIFTQGDGHGEGKNIAGAHGCNIELLEYVGGSTLQARQPDSWEGWYWGAKHMWGMEPLGQNTNQNGVFRDITENGDAVLFWGCDPETTPWGWGGLQASRMCFWFNEIGVKSIHIAPDANYANVVHADKWIPVLPNTDAALQLAIGYVWVTEGTYEREYLDTHAVGFDWFESYVLGNVDGIAKTPKWAEEKCGVPSWQIKALARYWAKHKVSIAHCNGGGFIRSCFSHEPARLEVALLAMRGFGQPGVHQFKFFEWTLLGQPNFSPLPLSETLPTNEPGYHGWAMNAGGVNDSIVKTRVADALIDKDAKWFGHGVCLYPREDQFRPMEYPVDEDEKIHMIWSDSPCWSACWNHGHKFQEAQREEDIEFIVVQHPWMENDTLYADIILPVSTVFETDDAATDTQGGQFALFFVEEHAIDPLCESRTDTQIAADIAEKLEAYGGPYTGLKDKFLKGRTVEESIRYTFDNSGIPEGFTWDDLQERGFYASPIDESWKTVPAGMLNFYEDPETFRLSTPTGKIEFYSTTLAEVFPDDMVRGPYPQWIEETDEHKERISSDRAEDYPYLLVSNHPRWRVHAQLDDVPWLHEIETCKVEGPDGYLYEPVWINPVDAEKHDIKTGDIVKLFNERGGVLGGARVTERIMPGALYQDHGANIDSIISGCGGLDRGGSNNLICPGATTSKNVSGEVTNGYLVGIEKVDIFELAEQHPEAFSREYQEGIGIVAANYIVEEA